MAPTYKPGAASGSVARPMQVDIHTFLVVIANLGESRPAWSAHPPVRGIPAEKFTATGASTDRPATAEQGSTTVPSSCATAREPRRRCRGTPHGSPA